MADSAVFFDFDDTLINTSEASSVAYECVKSFLADNGTEVVPPEKIGRIIELYIKLLSSTPHETYKLHSPKKIRVELWEKALQECVAANKGETAAVKVSVMKIHDLAEKLYHKWYTARIEALHWLEAETVPTLLALRQKYKLVLITNGSSVVQWGKIKHIGAERFFDHVLVSGDEPHDKPDKSIFLKACDLCHTTPKKSVMIGDNVDTDILGANLAGLSSAILFQTPGLCKLTKKNAPSEDYEENRKPNTTIASITEIPAVLDKIFVCQ